MYNSCMKKKIQNDLIVHSSDTLHLIFDDFDGLEQYGKNWSFYCKYRFGTANFSGRYDIYQDENFQLGTSQYNDGLMFNGHSASDTISVALVMKADSTFCINKKIMYLGEVIVFDDKEEYETIFSKAIIVGTASIKKSFVNKFFPFLNEMLNGVYRDNNGELHNFLQEIKSGLNKENAQTRFIDVLNKSLQNQKQIPKTLTKGEALAFSARNHILSELESCIKVTDIALKYDISEKTLQNSFKSLFGFTPKQFIRLLKLNLAHRDFSHASDEITVSDVATKWGFSHFGRFSKEYKELFGVKPSEALQKFENENSHIDDICLIK